MLEITEAACQATGIEIDALFKYDHNVQAAYTRKLAAYACTLAGHNMCIIADFLKADRQLIYRYVREVKFALEHYRDIKGDMKSTKFKAIKSFNERVTISLITNH